MLTQSWRPHRSIMASSSSEGQSCSTEDAATSAQLCQLGALKKLDFIKQNCYNDMNDIYNNDVMIPVSDIYATS